MFSLIMVVISIALLAAMLLVTVNYLPAWKGTSDSTSATVLTALKTVRAEFAARWTADNGNGSVQSGNYQDAPVINNGVDGGLAANFSGYGFLPGAPAGYAWGYGHLSAAALSANGYPYGIPANGLSYFCMYPTGAGVNQGVLNGIRAAIRNFGGNANQIFLTQGTASACGSWVHSGNPPSFPYPYVLTMFVRCSFTPSPSYSTTGQGTCAPQ